jgi:hypothetical protein
MNEHRDKFGKLLEPDANTAWGAYTPEISASIAISLKRIADALELINQRDEIRYLYEHK